MKRRLFNLAAAVSLLACCFLLKLFNELRDTTYFEPDVPPMLRMGKGWEMVWLGAACALCLVLPAAWMGHWLRTRRRHARGRCLSCGYDLRATPERCPECGGEADAARAS